MPAVYKKMGDALRKTGRPIVFSLCENGQQRGPANGVMAGPQCFGRGETHFRHGVFQGLV